MQDLFFSVKFAVICALVHTALYVYNEGINSFSDVIFYVILFIFLVLLWRCAPYIVCGAFGVIIGIIITLFRVIQGIFSKW